MNVVLSKVEEIAGFDAPALIGMINEPACTYSTDSMAQISQNTAFEILFKGMHPLDVITKLPEDVRDEMAEHELTSKKTIHGIDIGDKHFSSIEILPIYRDFLLKFSIGKPFITDYQQIFRIIFDNSPLGILLIDKNLKFIAANKAVCRMTGYSLNELKQMTFDDVTHREDSDGNIHLTRKLYSEEAGTFTIQKRFKRKDGESIWINLVTGLTKDLNGEFFGGVGIVEDITGKLDVEKQRSELLHSLREKNKEIVDSLAYARNIQNTVLPRNDQFKKFFPKHFIYYVPRDIVGGDFYWIRSFGDKIYFAVADCTGHGVPGAFISLIGNYRLNLIFEKYREGGPAVLLEKLNNIMAYSFRHSRLGQAHHGMDIAMCCLNMSNFELEYAGANNSLYLIREGIRRSLGEVFADEKKYRYMNEDLLEFRADNQAIGSYSGSYRFNRVKLEVKKGDRLYLFSDGYADQFGGEKAKKLKSHGFKSFLASQMHGDFKKQREKLHEFRKSWQGSLAQVDDICVIGIEI